MSEPAATTDIELAAEQGHLAASRAQLARMRERTASLDSAAGGDWVSREYLQSTFALRMNQLADDPSIALFFGRVDYDVGEVFHIGRRHVSDPAGEPMVIDWRAPISRAFYRATRTEPMGVMLRRRFGFERGVITAYEDEHLQDRSEAEGRSAILAGEIERPRVGPMRDIVATIQPEQDVIVRADVTRRSACRAPRVPGRPRSGCTGRRTCSTPTGTGCAAEGCWSSARTRLSCATSGGAAGARRDGREADDDRGAGRGHPRPAAAPQRHPWRGHCGRRHPQGRRADGGGAGAGTVVTRRHADRGPGRTARRAPVAGRDLRDRRPNPVRR